jgi:hypothetical protein
VDRIELFCVPQDYQPEYDDGTKYPTGFYYWFVQPGYLPDSDPIGPFDTEAEAESDYRSLILQDSA